MIKTMDASDRRSFLGMIFAAAAGLAAMPSRLEGQQPAKHPPFPDQKPGENEPEVKPDPHALLKENQKNIKKDVERLVELAEDLKKEVDKTDSADVLSLQMVKKAEEIEKLARQIKNRARG
jgi:nucleotide-binding universal stress UspA family protein